MALKELLDSRKRPWLIESKYVTAVVQSPASPTQVLVYVVGLDGPIATVGGRDQVAEDLGLKLPRKMSKSKV